MPKTEDSSMSDKFKKSKICESHSDEYVDIGLLVWQPVSL